MGRKQAQTAKGVYESTHQVLLKLFTPVQSVLWHGGEGLVVKSSGLFTELLAALCLLNSTTVGAHKQQYTTRPSTSQARLKHFISMPHH